jgi:hypothetical protein
MYRKDGHAVVFILSGGTSRTLGRIVGIPIADALFGDASVGNGDVADIARKGIAQDTPIVVDGGIGSATSLDRLVLAKVMLTFAIDLGVTDLGIIVYLQCN